ncbi:MAG: nickel pincer cofactor biosynthesis protein LarC [Thaumarchaeota archaeon]|nr:nickel pincer cofactor biosynthesis protein LarC [Nitrososphaerota archaeon]
MKDESKVLIVDCQTAGISGDMLLSALVDLGADSKKIIHAIKTVKRYVQGCKQITAEFREVSRKGFRAKALNLHIKEEERARSADEVRASVIRCVADLGLSLSARKFARQAVDNLVSAESRIHNLPSDRVHLHEAGSADTVIDIVGVAAALDYLSLLDAHVYCTPIAVGGGLHSFSHGIVSLPAPATLEILKRHKMKVIGGPVESELTTPTGAALLTAMVDQCVDYYPLIKLDAAGYGAGSKDLRQIPNLIRLILGTSEPPHLTDKVFLLETNIDDASGEVLGYTLQRLYDEGALDVSIIPISTKKSRPGCILRVVSDKEHVNKLSDVLIVDGGTLGVRVMPVLRHIANRDSQTVRVSLRDSKYDVRVKVSKDRFGRIVKFKPEFDDVEKIARRLGMPFREIAEKVSEAARKKIDKRDSKA